MVGCCKRAAATVGRMERIVKQSWYGNSEFGLSGTFRNQNGMVSRSLEDFSLDDNISRVAMTINDNPIIASSSHGWLAGWLAGWKVCTKAPLFLLRYTNMQSGPRSILVRLGCPVCDDRVKNVEYVNNVDNARTSRWWHSLHRSNNTSKPSGRKITITTSSETVTNFYYYYCCYQLSTGSTTKIREEVWFGFDLIQRLWSKL
jgi:hypothetical protein